MPTLDLLEWLREQCAEYEFDVVALYRTHGDHPWPLTAHDEVELELKLEDGAHFLPLPKEPAALANILEVSVVDYLLERFENRIGLQVARGTERGYPDLEVTGSALDNAFYAVDIKVARRSRSGRRTQSRITLYTGNTFFRYPQLRWPGTFRPFENYEQHLTLVVLYDLEPTRRRAPPHHGEHLRLAHSARASAPLRPVARRGTRLPLPLAGTGRTDRHRFRWT